MGDRGRADLPFSPRPAWAVFTEQDSARGVVPPNVWAAIDYGGSGGWAITPSGMRGVLNGAVSLYFADATLASAFVARWDLTPHSVRCSPPRPAALKVREWISSALASILRTWNRPPVVSTLDPAHPVRRNFRNRTVF